MIFPGGFVEVPKDISAHSNDQLRFDVFNFLQWRCQNPPESVRAQLHCMVSVISRAWNVLGQAWMGSAVMVSIVRAWY